MKKYHFIGENSPFDVDNETWRLVPAVDLEKFIEVEYLHADTIITADTCIERIERLGYDKPPDGGELMSKQSQSRRCRVCGGQLEKSPWTMGKAVSAHNCKKCGLAVFELANGEFVGNPS